MKFTALTLAVAAVSVQAQTSAPTLTPTQSPTVTVTLSPTAAPLPPTDICDVPDQVQFANSPNSVPCGAGYSTNWFEQCAYFLFDLFYEYTTFIFRYTCV